MSEHKIVELELDQLEHVSGGAFGTDPDGCGTYILRCEFSGEVYYGISRDQILQINQYAAAIPNTPEGEQQVLAWARSKGFI